MIGLYVVVGLCERACVVEVLTARGMPEEQTKSLGCWVHLVQYLYPEHACVMNVPTGFVNDEEPTGRSRTLDTPGLV